jgi:hypothetical protein
MKLIKLLSKFHSFNDRESEAAFFLTNVPWVAPQAYLNIIFKPAPTDALNHVKTALALPASFCELLGSQNGAIMFSGALCIYGVHKPRQLLDRSNPFALPPFDIELENSNWPPDDAERLVAIGAYGADGSRVCMDRFKLHLELWPREAPRLRSSPPLLWESLDQWILSEIPRLSMLFNETGKLLVADAETLPLQSRRPN